MEFSLTLNEHENYEKTALILKEDLNRFKLNEVYQSGTKVLLSDIFANGMFLNRNPYFP